MKLYSTYYNPNVSFSQNKFKSRYKDVYNDDYEPSNTKVDFATTCNNVKERVSEYVAMFFGTEEAVDNC